jgi:hypothetical protein
LKIIQRVQLLAMGKMSDLAISKSDESDIRDAPNFFHAGREHQEHLLTGELAAALGRLHLGQSASVPSYLAQGRPRICERLPIARCRFRCIPSNRSQRHPRAQEKALRSE